MSAITRTVQSTSTKEVSTAVCNGWNLNFTVETIGEQVKSINVNGDKGQSYFSANYNENGHINLSFSQSSYDADLADEVAAEMEAIVNQAEE